MDILIIFQLAEKATKMARIVESFPSVSIANVYIQIQNQPTKPRPVSSSLLLLRDHNPIPTVSETAEIDRSRTNRCCAFLAFLASSWNSSNPCLCLLQSRPQPSTIRLHARRRQQHYGILKSTRYILCCTKSHDYLNQTWVLVYCTLSRSQRAANVVGAITTTAATTITTTIARNTTANCTFPSTTSSSRQSSTLASS